MEWPEVIVPIITPIASDGDIHIQDVSMVWEYLVDNGIRAVFSLGLTGETDSMSNKQREKVMMANSMFAAYHTLNSKKISLFIGCNGSDLEETMDNIDFIQSEHLQKKDAIVLQPGALTGVDYSGLISKVNEKAEVPVFIYINTKNPDRDVTPEMLQELSSLDMIAGAKISSPDFNVLARYCSRTYAEDFRLYVGNAIDICRMPEMKDWETKPYGIVTGPGNLFPSEWLALWEACKRGEGIEEAGRFAHAFKKIYGNVPGNKNTVATIKHYMQKRGIISSPVCFTRNHDEKTRGYLDEKMQEFGFKSPFLGNI